VDEESLKLALAKVHDDEPHGECLGDGRVRDRFAVVVEEKGAGEEYGGMDEQWSKIFNDEHGFPCYLRTW